MHFEKSGVFLRTASFPNMSQLLTTPLYVPPVAINDAEPAFHGDLFERGKLATRLTACIDRLPNGGVIAIDAPWGEGKSWFGQHWHKQLKTNGYRTAFINAFERDYVEEPFVMLVSELLASLQDSEKSKLKKTGIAVAKALAPLAAKSAINAVAHLLTGTTDFSEKVDGQIENAGNAIATGAEKLLSKQIEDYEKSKVAVDGFRKTLGEIASTQDKPIVIFVDELDRCRPEFAVKLIERVKHFFEMPNVVFVLLLNRDQLCKAIKGIYGIEIDADRYLSKFLHLTLVLPKSTSLSNSRLNPNCIHCYSVMARFGLSDPSFCDDMGIWATVCVLSLRDIERSVSLYSLSRIHERLTTWICWPIVIKTTNPEVFAGVLKNDKQAHQVCIDILSGADRKLAEYGFIDLRTGTWKKLHLASIHGNAAPYAGEANVEFTQMFRSFNFQSASDLIPYFFSAVDIGTK
jgi:hypothetical protein